MKGGVLVACVLSIAVADGPLPLGAQSPAPAPAPAFEVASVKPSNPNPATLLESMPMMRPMPGGRLTVSNLSPRLLVRMAYEVQDFQIIGGPSWLSSSKFDITAKAPDGAPEDAPGTMARLKTLLADRFKLALHKDSGPRKADVGRQRRVDQHVDLTHLDARLLHRLS